MPSFWPKGLDLKDISSPRKILEAAQREWHEHSDGLLTLVIQDTESEKGNAMFIVHAKHVPSNRTVSLFSVVHRHDAPYPARIQPRSDELPSFLRKTYTQGGASDISETFKELTRQTTQTVINKWVCDTPGEFRSRLEDVFDLGAVKSEILNLIAVGDSLTAGYETEITDSTSPVEADDEL